MKIAPVTRQGSLSPSRFNLRDTLQGTLQIFSVDRQNRWPVQGWSSGDESHYDLDYDLAVEEGSREFTLSSDTRWPLQGWCKASESHGKNRVSTKPAKSRWPQGW